MELSGFVANRVGKKLLYVFLAVGELCKEVLMFSDKVEVGCEGGSLLKIIPLIL